MVVSTDAVTGAAVAAGDAAEDAIVNNRMRGAIEAGFEVVVARDATATVSADAYEAALASFGLLAKATPSTAEIVGSLSTAAAA